MNLTPFVLREKNQRRYSCQGQASLRSVLRTLDRSLDTGKKLTNHKWCFVRLYPHKYTCSKGHLTVSSQDLLMGQKVMPLLTPGLCHGTESREDDWSSRGVEYPSGLGNIKNFHSKAVYMTETTVTSKKILHSSLGPYMTTRWKLIHFIYIKLTLLLLSPS